MARPTVAADRRRAKAARRATRASRDVATSSGNGRRASRGLAGASRRTRSAAQRTSSASRRMRRAAQRMTSAARASIDPALVAVVAHLLAPRGTHSRPSAPLRVTRASALAPPSPLPLEREALAWASASRETESASRNGSRAALGLRGAALARPNSAHDGAHVAAGRRDEALAASNGAHVKERGASRSPRAARNVPRAAPRTPRAALPASRAALVTPRAALERRTFSQTAGSVPRGAMECAGVSRGFRAVTGYGSEAQAPARLRSTRTVTKTSAPAARVELAANALGTEPGKTRFTAHRERRQIVRARHRQISPLGRPLLNRCTMARALVQPISAPPILSRRPYSSPRRLAGSTSWPSSRGSLRRGGSRTTPRSSRSTVRGRTAGGRLHNEAPRGLPGPRGARPRG